MAVVVTAAVSYAPFNLPVISYLEFNSLVAEETCEATDLACEVISDKTLELTEAVEPAKVLLYSELSFLLLLLKVAEMASGVSANSTEMLRPSTRALLSKTAVEAAAADSKKISASFERPSSLEMKKNQIIFILIYNKLKKTYEEVMVTDLISPQKEK